MTIIKDNEWKQLFKAIPSHTIRDVEIFAAGVHNGDTYTTDDLDQIINTFYSLRGRIDPPLKIGHSSDKFNKEIAMQFGLPGGVITGDKGEGALSFGWVDNLRRYGDIMVADFVNVPEQIVTLVESQLYRHVSCEITCNYDDGGKTHPYLLSGIALLGAEQQAVSEIRGLDKAMVYTANKANKVKTYTYGGEMDKGLMSKMMDKLKELMGMMNGEMEKPEDMPKEDMKAKDKEEADMKEVNKTLGLAEGATEKEAVAEIVKLKAVSNDTKKYTDLEAQVKTYKDRAETAEAAIKKQDRSARVAKYTAIAGTWTAIAGKPDEMAERIVSLEDLDPKAAEGLVKTYTDMNASALAVGLTKPLGTAAAATGDGGAFEQKVKLLQDEKDADGVKRYATYHDAFRAASDQYPEEYREYRKTN